MCRTLVARVWSVAAERGWTTKNRSLTERLETLSQTDTDDAVFGSVPPLMWQFFAPDPGFGGDFGRRKIARNAPDWQCRCKMNRHLPSGPLYQPSTHGG
jgi:hypothetical protein